MAYAQQPKGNPGMTVGSGSRNTKALPVDTNGQREWSESIYGCWGDSGTYIVACFCPCIVYSRVKHRYEVLASTGRPAGASDSEGGGVCTADCVIHGVVSWAGLGWIMQMMQRGSIRDRYNIKGGGLGDCCTAFWCTPCELTQESREIELEERSLGGS